MWEKRRSQLGSLVIVMMIRKHQFMSTVDYRGYESLDLIELFADERDRVSFGLLNFLVTEKFRNKGLSFSGLVELLGNLSCMLALHVRLNRVIS